MNESGVRAVVIGAGGYTGAEAVGILLRHPRVKLVGLFGSSKRSEGGTPPRFDAIFPRFRKRTDLEVRATDPAAVLALRPDVVFLATPHEASLALVPALAAAKVLVIDLSAAFRLKEARLYPEFYGFEHGEPGLLEQAAYGLPELFRGRLREADVIAAPGCYPTSAVLPLAPLVRAGAVRRGTRPIIDSTSGVSGAGRAPEEKNLFCEVSQRAYNVFRHRHGPEISAYAGAEVIFTAHVGPYDRGILSTIHVELSEHWDAARVFATMHAAYGNEPFVRLLPAGEWPSVGAVRGTNYCDMAWAVEHADAPAKHLILVSAIDNLVKGAAGQAVQCMNIRLGLPESMGLTPEAA